MNNILTIMKKEFFRFFHDKRMVLSVLLLPGLMIYVMYTFMGKAVSSANTVSNDYQTSVYAENMPASLKPAFDSLNIEYRDNNETDRDEMMKSVEDKNTDLVMIFPEDFEQRIAVYDSSTDPTGAPQVAIYYNSSRTESNKAYSAATAILDQYESSMINKFDINHDADSKYDLASDKDYIAKLFSSLFPMLLMMFIFSACMSIAPEAIAGEKERGTLTTVLCTPIKRSQLAIGKICSLSCIAVLSGISSFIGTILSLPKFLEMGASDINTNVYHVSDYVILLVIVICSVLLIIALISVISAYAKSVKEASALVTPLMIVIMLISLTTVFGVGIKTESFWYLIPLYNSVQCMSSVFTFNIQIINVVITVAMNIVYTGAVVFLLTKMFNSEKVMLSK